MRALTLLLALMLLASPALAQTAPVPAYWQMPLTAGDAACFQNSGSGTALRDSSVAGCSFMFPAPNPIAISGYEVNIQNSSTTWQTLYQSLHGAQKIWNGAQVAIVNPVGSTNLETDAINFQVANYAVHSTGVGNAVGVRGDVYTLTDGGFTWWANPGFSDTLTGTCASCGARDLELMEVDVGIKSANTTWHGIVFTGSTTVNPAAATAVSAGCLAGAVNATTGVCVAQYNPAPFVVPSGVTTTGLLLGSVAQAVGGSVVSQPSQIIEQDWIDSTGTGQAATQQVQVAAPPYLSLSSTGTSGYGLAVTGTGGITTVVLSRQDTVTGAGENIFDIYGIGKNTAGANKQYTQIRSVGVVTTAGTEMGRFQLFAMNNAGVLTEYLRITGGATGAVATQNGATMTAASYSAGASAGVSCTGTPTASFASVGGIVTHC